MLVKARQLADLTNNETAEKENKRSADNPSMKGGELRTAAPNYFCIKGEGNHSNLVRFETNKLRNEL